MNRSGVIIGLSTFLVVVLLALEVININRGAYVSAYFDIGLIVVNAVLIGVNIGVNICLLRARDD